MPRRTPHFIATCRQIIDLGSQKSEEPRIVSESGIRALPEGNAGAGGTPARHRRSRAYRLPARPRGPKWYRTFGGLLSAACIFSPTARGRWAQPNSSNCRPPGSPPHRPTRRGRSGLAPSGRARAGSRAAELRYLCHGMSPRFSAFRQDAPAHKLKIKCRSDVTN